MSHQVITVEQHTAFVNKVSHLAKHAHYGVIQDLPPKYRAAVLAWLHSYKIASPPPEAAPDSSENHVAWKALMTLVLGDDPANERRFFEHIGYITSDMVLASYLTDSDTKEPIHPETLALANKIEPIVNNIIILVLALLLPARRLSAAGSAVGSKKRERSPTSALTTREQDQADISATKGN